MKPRHLACFPLAILFACASADATNFYWDAAPGTGTSPNLNQNGSGTWDAVTNNWIAATPGSGAQALWTNTTADTAFLGNVTGTGYTNASTGGTITLGQNITASSLSMSSGQTGSYIIDPGAGPYTLTVTSIGNNNTTANLTVNAVVAGSNLSKINNGRVILNGANTYTGSTTVSAGTLAFSNAGLSSVANGLGRSSNIAANLLLANGTTLQYTGSGGTTDRLFTINGTAAGHSATLDASGTGAVNFSNTGNIAYGTTAQTRTLSLTGTSTANNILAAAITNNGGSAVSVTKSGAGTWVLSGTNDHTGATAVNGGILDFQKTSAKSAGSTVTVAAGASVGLGVGGAGYYSSGDVDALFSNSLSGFSLDASSGVAIDTTAGGFTYATSQTAARSLTKLGANTLTISGTNSYSGGTIIDGGGGSIAVQGNQSAATGGWSIGTSAPATSSTVNFQSGSAVAVASGRSIQIGASSQIGSTVQNSQVLNVAGTVTNDGTLLVGREGALTISSGGAWTQSGGMNLSSFGGVALSMTVNTSGSFTYTGSTAVGVNSAPGNIGSPTLSVAGGTFITGKGFNNNTAASTGTSGLVLSGGGTLRLSADVSNLTSSSGGAFVFQLGTGGGIIDTQGFSTTIDRSISNVPSQSGALKKDGNGTLTLTGASNTYAGGTTLAGGKLVLSHNSAAGTAGVVVSGDSTILEISSGITIANNVTVSNATANVVHGVAAAGVYHVGTSGVLKSSFATATPDTTAGILAGTSSGASTLTMSFSGSSAATNDAIRLSDVFTVGGTGSDLYVLQLSAATLPADSVLAYQNGGIWDLAIAGNTGVNNASAAQQNYAGSFSAFQAAFGSALDFYQGAYGMDAATNSLWAVVNYGGSFSAVPEPTGALAGLLVGAGCLRRRRA